MESSPRNQQTFLDLVNAHPGVLRRLCRVYAADAEDRQDLWQQILLQLWRSYPSYDGRAAFSTWMFRVALNTALMHRRGRTRRLPTIPLDDASFREPAAPDRSLPDDVHHLYAAIADLAPLDRAIAVLRLEDRTLQEIADVTGLSTGAVSVRLVRITEKLRRAMGVDVDADKETT